MQLLFEQFGHFPFDRIFRSGDLGFDLVEGFDRGGQLLSVTDDFEVFADRCPDVVAQVLQVERADVSGTLCGTEHAECRLRVADTFETSGLW